MRSILTTILGLAIATAGFAAAAKTVLVSNDAQLAQAIVSVSEGDTIELASGNYGRVLIMGGQYNQVTVGSKRIYKKTPILTGGVTIKSQDVNNRATLDSIDVRTSNYWQFDSLDIRPASRSLGFISVKLNGNDMSFNNSTISFGDSTGWTAQDWVNTAGRGVFVDGNNAVVQNNTMQSVDIGVVVNHYAINARVVNNTVDGISGDGGRALGNNALFEGNFFKNFVEVNGNHDDCIQAFSKENGVIGAGSVDDVQIRGNLCISSEDVSNPLYSPVQGYVSFDGEMKDWIVEDNITLSSGYHGITLGHATNAVIRNNTILDDLSGVNGDDTVWIRIFNGGSNLIENNLTNNVGDMGTANLVGNQEIDIADYDVWFTDWKNGDFTIKPTAPISGVGASGFSGGSSTVLTNNGVVDASFLTDPDHLAIPVPMSGLLALSGIALLAGLRRRSNGRAV